MRYKYFAAVSIIFLVQIVFLTNCSNSIEDKLIGEWKGTDSDGKSTSYIFNEDGTAQLMRGNIVRGGSSENFAVRWLIDITQKPMHLDIIKIVGDSIKIYPMIFRLVRENKIQIRFGKDLSERPIEFSDIDKTKQIILTRQ